VSGGRLGRGIAAILSIGTVLAVLVVGIGFAVASMTGLPSEGARPLTDYLVDTGPDTPIAVGLLALTLLPLIAVGFAARAFAAGGERRHLGAALVVLALLAGSLVVGAVLGAPS
jgi:Protein of unknown function (DUF1634)